MTLGQICVLLPKSVRKIDKLETSSSHKQSITVYFTMGKSLTKGSRVNGKDWKDEKLPSRIKSIGIAQLSSFEKRKQLQAQQDQYKARLNTLKQEKEDEKQNKINEVKRRREIKAEKERLEKMASKLKQKKLDRLRKKEKRNKLLKER